MGRRRGGGTAKVVSVRSDAQSATLMFPRLSKVASSLPSGEKATDRTSASFVSVLVTLLALTSHRSIPWLSGRIPGAHGQKVAGGEKARASVVAMGNPVNGRLVVKSQSATWSPQASANTVSSFETATARRGRGYWCSVNNSSPWQSCHR